MGKSFILNLEEQQKAACVIPGRIIFEKETEDDTTTYGHLDIDLSYIIEFIQKNFADADAEIEVSVVQHSDPESLTISFYSEDDGGLG